VLEATLLIEGELELPALLRHVIEEARSMTGARYGALGVLSDDGTSLSEFITVGLTPEEEERIGPRPTGQGVLGLLIDDPRPMRLTNLSNHPDSFGFPPGHPPMTSFLGVPIRVREEIYGNLYLTDKIGWTEFTDGDAGLVGALALSAGIAIENHRLHQREQMVAIYKDRDRLARDLHDTVIQRLFGIGLTLQSLVARPPEDVPQALETAVVEIDEVISQVRSTIYELGMTERSRGLRDSILALVRDLGSLLGLEIQATFEGPVDAAVSDLVAEQICAAIREWVSHIGHHAGATRVSLSVSVEDGRCRLVMVDNGQGSGAVPEDVQGIALEHLRHRAETMAGALSIEHAEGGGTSLDWRVPI
jgi:signal transduction histidine kinase